MSFTIAPTRADQIPALQAVERAAAEMFRGLDLLSFPADFTNEQSHETYMAARLSFTASSGDAPVGFVIGRLFPPDAYLAELSVEPAHGRRGIGRALIDRFSEAAAAQGAQRIVLSTFRDVPWNAPLYETLGFVKLTHAEMSPWMLQIETRQAEHIDVSKRCFMQRPAPQ